MKHKWILFAGLVLLITGCTQNNWMDWKTQNDVWLEANAKKEGVITTESGLQYKVIADPNPTDARPSSASTVVCNYKGRLINGYVFDSNNSVSLSMASVVSGFAEGLKKIHANGDVEVYVPYYLGYDETVFTNGKGGEAEGNGTEGTTGYIPPYSVMIFEIHLCAVTGS